MEEEMNWFCGKKKTLYRVKVHCNGRHPYLTSNELDYPTRIVYMDVPAKNWNDAEKQALSVYIPNCWSRSVLLIVALGRKPFTNPNEKPKSE